VVSDLSLIADAMFGLAESCPNVDTSVLTERQIVVLYLRYVKDMETAEVAEVLGLKSGSVNAIHRRAMERLRSEVCGP